MKFIIFALIPLILSVGITPALSFDFVPESDALKSKGNSLTEIGSKKVCGDRLCSELENDNLYVSTATADAELEKQQLERTDMIIDYKKESSLLPEHFGGVGPMTVTPSIGEVTKHYPEVYVPGTEELDENEMRIFACGTGSPWIVPAQKGSCFLIQTGDGHNLIFDIGGGSIANVNSLGLAADDLNHIFVSHLHVDHVGDLDMFWAQGFM